MTHHTLMADRKCGMNQQAAELLARMSSEIIELPDSMFITTHPYCNCREMGFILRIFSARADSENIAFYEHRNSDQLCAIRWTGDVPISGAVTARDIPESAFPNKWSVSASWPCASYDEAIEYARIAIRGVIARSEKAAA
ncbi:MAG: hypothetical protein U0835_00475 [Isosphaeraceae bacterium]